MSTVEAPNPEPLVPEPTVEYRYDAFVSYSHSADGELAPRLRLALERLAKPWYRRRALAVYLDSAGMEVTPALWRTITAALDSSGHLILLCSPGAAASDYVNREVAYWLEHRSAETILPVLTAGELEWDEELGRWDPDRSTAAPPSLSEAFAETPRYLDLRWTKPDVDGHRRTPQFRDAMAELAAPLTGREKSDLVGEDVRRHRTTLRTAWSAAAALAVLLVVSVIAATLATVRGDEAVRQADLATSRQLAAQSTDRASADPQLATLLALAAASVDDTPEAAASMLRMTEQTKRITGFLGGHSGIVETAAFSPDGGLVATAGPDDPVRLWDIETRTVVAELPASGVSSLVFTPDGASLAVTEVGRTLIWDVGTRAVRAELPGDALVAAVSADGHRLVSAYDGPVTVWDLPSRTKVAELAGADGTVTGLALSPDGALAAAGDWDGTTLVWEIATGSVITTTAGYPQSSKGRAVFSPDGRTLAVSGANGAVQLLDVATRAWSILEGQSRTIQGLAFIDDRTLVSAAFDGTVVVRDLDTGEAASVLAGPLTASTGTALSPDGRTAATGNFDGTAVLWRLDDDWALPLGSPTGTSAVAVDPTGTLTATVDATGAVVEVTGPAGTRSLTPPELAVAVDFAGPDRLAVALLDGGAALLDPATGDVMRSFPGTVGDPLVSVDVSPDGTLLAGGAYSGNATVWSVEDTAVVAEIPAAAEVSAAVPVIYTHVAFSPDGRTLAHSSITELRLWDVPSRTPRALLNGPSDIGTSSLAWSRDGGLLAQGGVDSTVVLWDPSTPEQHRGVLAGHPAAVAGLSFGADGTLAAGSSGGGSVILWDVAQRSPRAALRAGTGPSLPLYSPDGTDLMIADRTGLHRYELDPAQWRDRLCGLVGRDLTADEWAAYLPGRMQTPVCIS